MNIKKENLVERNIILIHHACFKLKGEIDAGNKQESPSSLIFVASDSTANFIDHPSSASHCVNNLVDSAEDSARIPVFWMNSLILGWSVEFSLLSHNSDTSDFQTFLWLVSLLILGLSRGDNCFYLFIFNSWSINTPGNMTHQPLAIPHKETELFGAAKIWFWGSAV